MKRYAMRTKATEKFEVKSEASNGASKNLPGVPLYRAKEYSTCA